MTYLIFVVVQATYNFVIVWQYKKNINCLLWVLLIVQVDCIRLFPENLGTWDVATPIVLTKYIDKIGEDRQTLPSRRLEILLGDWIEKQWPTSRGNGFVGYLQFLGHSLRAQHLPLFFLWSRSDRPFCRLRIAFSKEYTRNRMCPPWDDVFWNLRTAYIWAYKEQQFSEREDTKDNTLKRGTSCLLCWSHDNNSSPLCLENLPCTFYSFPLQKKL